MQSDEHAAVGATVAAILSIGFIPYYSGTFVVGMYLWGVLVSVLVDLDHFLIARYYFGHWNHLERCLRRPRWALTEQDEIFDDEESEVITSARLVTHPVLGVALSVLLLAAYGIGAGVYTACLVGIHIVSDLLRDRGTI